MNGHAVATAFLGDESRVAQEDHPLWDRIVDVHAKFLKREPFDEQEAFDLLHIPESLKREFEKLSERFAIERGVIFYDGDELHNAVADQILKVIDEGDPMSSIVNFAEKIMLNPNDHSREQLYAWLDQNDFEITDSGDIVVYKGCVNRDPENDDDDIDIQSSHSGTDTVIVTPENGKPFKVTGQVPQPIGGSVEMARGNVHHDPGRACDHGLHVGTLKYAKAFSRTRLLRCLVNPRDVVSVPTDSTGFVKDDNQKIRVSRYRIIEEINEDGSPKGQTSADICAEAGCEKHTQRCSQPQIDCVSDGISTPPIFAGHEEAPVKDKEKARKWWKVL
jgi:hypothetical protein